MTTLFPILIPHSYAFMTDFLQDNEPSIGHPNSHQHPINLLRIKKFLKTPPPHSQLPPLTPTQSSTMLFVDSNIKDISATSPLPHTFPYRSFTSLSPSLLGSTPFLFPQGLLLPWCKTSIPVHRIIPFWSSTTIFYSSPPFHIYTDGFQDNPSGWGVYFDSIFLDYFGNVGLSKHMSDRWAERMSDKMPDRTLENMPDRIPEYMCPRR